MNKPLHPDKNMMNPLSDVSVIIKTFLRPECLANILESFRNYQRKHSANFAKIIVIDDSDDDCSRRNAQICASYPDMPVELHAYQFNTLGLSKGRNVALEITSTPYFLLCDDDFILDEACDIATNLQTLHDNELDILGGFYRNISAPDSPHYNDLNWLGFITETQEFDTCLIFSDYYPRFCHCDIVQNFYLGKTAAVRHVGYPEDMPLLEHNVFFLRAKQAGLKVAFTSALWTKHYHLPSNRTYENFRNRVVVNPVSKPVRGYSISKDKIFEFYDYLNTSGTEYMRIGGSSPEKYARENYTFKVNLHFCRGVLYFSFLRSLHKLYNRSIGKFLNRRKLSTIRKEYPTVLSTAQTLHEIVTNRKSIARFGDGEFKLINGEGLGQAGTSTEYQVFDPTLSRRLKEVLQSQSPECIVAIAPFHDDHNNQRNYMDGLSYWEYYWVNNWERIKKHLVRERTYGSSFVSRLTVFRENSLADIRNIWDGRNVLFVVGENSHFYEEPRLFDNIAESVFLIAKGRSTFSDYDKILKAIMEYDTSWLVMLALGPTATVLAYDLCQAGYQSLDIGHLPNCFLEAMGERKAPEAEHHKGDFFRYDDTKHRRI